MAFIIGNGSIIIGIAPTMPACSFTTTTSVPITTSACLGVVFLVIIILVVVVSIGFGPSQGIGVGTGLVSENEGKLIKLGVITITSVYN